MDLEIGGLALFYSYCPLRPYLYHNCAYEQFRIKHYNQIFRIPFITKAVVASLINLTSMFLDCGRKLEYPERPHTGT